MKKQILSEKTKSLIIQKLEKLTKLLNEKQINLIHIVMQNEEETKKVLKICSRKKYSKNDLIYKWKLMETPLAADQSESYQSFMRFNLIGQTNYRGKMSLQKIYFDFCYDEEKKICVFWNIDFDAWFSNKGFDCFCSDQEITLKDFSKEITKIISFEEKLANFLKS
jgi:hypothetical protein